MFELYEMEGPLRFCKLTVHGNNEEDHLKIRLWINRIMEPEAYSYYEDYSVGTHEWCMCLTSFEQDQLERYLWENSMTNFILNVYEDKDVSCLIATTKEKG